jgi:hypothetical protein
MHSQNVRPRAPRWLSFVFVGGSATLGCGGDPTPLPWLRRWWVALRRILDLRPTASR